MHSALTALFITCFLIYSPVYAKDSGSKQALTEADAMAFLDAADIEIRSRSEEGARLSWIAANFITYDSQFVLAKHDARSTLYAVQLAKQAANYDDVKVNDVVRRKLDTLKQAIRLPAPDDKELAEELSTITTGLEARYGKGKYCPANKPKDDCLDLVQMNKIMANNQIIG